MDERFKRHWETWKALTAQGKRPDEFLASASDETLVELLAYAKEGSDLERNIIATELTNRISRLHRKVAGHGDRMEGLVDENQAALKAADEADERIREQTRSFRDETEKTSRYSERGKKRDGGW